MPQHRDQPTVSAPPNDPMGFGGEKRKPGYGKYDPTNGPTGEEARGVPGASGDKEHKPDGTERMAKGDEVTEEAA